MAADVFLSFHLICDCCRARIVCCFIITWWRTLKISIPQGDKTLHFDTIWILKGKNAAQVDFFFARFQCRLRDAVCEIVKIVVC
jgi:hypothetical protein